MFNVTIYLENGKKYHHRVSSLKIAVSYLELFGFKLTKLDIAWAYSGLFISGKNSCGDQYELYREVDITHDK